MGERARNEFPQRKKTPLKNHEIISVFGSKIKYNPQMTKGKPYKCKQGYKCEVYGGDNKKVIITVNNGEYYPKSVIHFNRDYNSVHPTQKPESLMEYLIKTYTDEGDVVLDFTMGSGTTGVAAVNTMRRFIGIELDKNYFKIAESRIKKSIELNKNRMDYVLI